MITADDKGRYGRYGGSYVPEMLFPNMDRLQTDYLRIIESEIFQHEFKKLLQHYVGRPTPLYKADNLGRKYGTTIFLKREDLTHTGAHKINNAIGQVLLALALGKKRVIAETGAGQHGVATATVCALMNLPCIVYMGEVDMQRQSANVMRMRMLGAEVRPVKSGSRTLKDATNEAIRDWINHPRDTYYIIGSVVGPHPYPDLVARLQSVISNEMRSQLQEQTGNACPDYVIACVGGGSNAAGAFYHYINEKVKLVAVEAAGQGIHTTQHAATMQCGRDGVLHGAYTRFMQSGDGQVLEPYSISAGLDYPGIGPMHAYLYETGRVSFLNATDDEALSAAFNLSRTEGIIPALESAHALAALEKMHFSAEDVVIVNLSGRGDKDMDTYTRVLTQNRLKNGNDS